MPEQSEKSIWVKVFYRFAFLISLTGAIYLAHVSPQCSRGMIWLCGACLVASGDLGSKGWLSMLHGRSDAHPQCPRRMPKMNKSANTIIPVKRIASSIYIIRGQRVMLSPDLAVLYGVEPRVLVQAVKRNSARFPADFMFQLTRREFNRLKSQIVTLDHSSKATPYAFTEHGVAMLSVLLRNQRPVDVTLLILGVFVRLRQLLAIISDVARRFGAGGKGARFRF